MCRILLLTESVLSLFAAGFFMFRLRFVGLAFQLDEVERVFAFLGIVEMQVQNFDVIVYGSSLEFDQALCRSRSLHGRGAASLPLRDTETAK